ncbi:polysaccharide deacetylase family protein [Temperatibacter marinus]|uniref:Chitooligosaccharide deacetylase n=1 Tax=Temperatibacter marinus TaxID=1456591 RepID=A0AA52HB07_9PROT|nr:polysaccharide deacetylase family protein [Temperatibacter marinus]WND04147.1 polysaccharide deacetylase family protein [Temperatibacter marinus]
MKTSFSPVTFVMIGLLCLCHFALSLRVIAQVSAQDTAQDTAQVTAQVTGLEDRSAVVYVYHRFGEDKYPSTNTRLEQIEAQIAFLQSEPFNFLSLEQFIHHMTADKPFPHKSVLFTVDDAYKSVLTEAWPRLKAAGIPLALFVSTDIIDQKIPGYMSWDDIRFLMQEGVAIAHHGAAHMHMVHRGIEAAEKDLDKASKRFMEELGFVPKAFAYPYGEYSKDIRNMVATKGFDLAFAQYSGAAGLNSDLMSLPRFAVNERYGKIGRFQLISRSIALPVSAVTPEDPYIENPAQNPPMIGFTLEKDIDAAAMTCFPSHLGGETATILKPTNSRYEIRFEKPLPKGRSRLNCTLLAGNKRWYWYSRYFLVPGGKLD